MARRKNEMPGLLMVRMLAYVSHRSCSIALPAAQIAEAAYYDNAAIR